MRQSVLLADGVHFGLCVGHQVVVTNDQRRVHAVPSEVPPATFAAAGAATGVRHRWTGRVHEFGHRHLRQRKDCFSLRIANVVVDHVARAQHDLHAECSGGLERLVHPRHECIHTHRRRLAPVKIPDVHGDDSDPLRIDFLLLNGDRAGARVAALQIQRQALR